MPNLSVPTDKGRLLRFSFLMVAAFLFAFCLPAAAKAAVSNLTVTPSNTDALNVSDYEIRFTTQESLTYSDYIYVKMPSGFRINTLTSSVSVGTDTGNWGGASFLIYTGSDYNTMRIGVPTSISAGETITLQLSGSANSISIVNPFILGGSAAYSVAVSLDNENWSETEVSITTNTEPDHPVLTPSPSEILPGNSNTWELTFGTSRPLQAGDVVRLEFPEAAELNFSSGNIVGYWGEARAIWLNGYAPDRLVIENNTVSFSVPANAPGTANTLSVEPNAMANPLAPGAYGITFMTSPNNVPVTLPFTVTPGNMTVSATSSNIYARQVDYSLTFYPRSVIDDSNRLLLSVPYYVPEDLTADRFTLNGRAVGSVSPDGGYYITPAPGESFSPGDPEPVVLTVHGLQNPQEPGTYVFGIRSEADSVTDYAGLNIADAPAVYDPSLFGHSLRLSNGQYLKVQPGAENNYSGSDAFTVSMWIKPDTAAGTQTLYHKSSGEAEQLSTWLYIQDGKLKAALDNYTSGSRTYLDAGQSLPTGAWTHAALAHTGSQARLFVNGQLAAETEAGYPYPFLSAGPSSQPVMIGNDTDRSSPYSGLIDEVQIWSQTLDAGLLKTYMYTGTFSLDSSSGQAHPASAYPFEPDTGILRDTQGSKPAQAFGTEHNGLHAVQDLTRYGTLPNPGASEPSAYRIVEAPARGAAVVLDPAAGAFAYTPEAAFTGTDSFVYGATGSDRATVLGTMDVTVEPNLEGPNGSDATLDSLTVNGEPVGLEPGLLHYGWTVFPGTWTVTVHAAGAFGQQITVGEEPITPQAGKDWDIHDGLNDDIPIQVESFDHTQTSRYLLSVYQVSESEENRIHESLGFLTEDLLRGDNGSLETVTMPLVLARPEQYGSFPPVPDNFGFRWESSRPDIVDPSGHVNRESLTEPVNVTLTAVISRDNYQVLKSFSATVLPNHKPVMDVLKLVTHGEALQGYLQATDDDLDVLHYELAPGTAQDRFHVSYDGAFTYTPQAGFTGEDRFTVKVSDEWSSTTAEVVFHVFDPGSADAKLVSLFINGLELPLADGVFTHHIVLPQETADVPVLVTGLPGQIITMNGVYTEHGTYDLDEAGTDILIRVHASETSPEYREYKLYVRREGDEERVYRIAKSISEHALLGSNAGLHKVTSDLVLHPDWVPADVSLLWHSSDETVIASDGKVQRPASGNAEVRLTLAVSKNGYEQNKEFLVTVIGLAPANLPPEAHPAAFAARAEPAGGSLAPYASDPEGSALSFSLADAALKGTASVNPDGTFTYVPWEFKYQTDTFTYTVSDGVHTSGAAAVTVTVYGADSSRADLQAIRISGDPVPAVGGGTSYAYRVPFSTGEAVLEAVGYAGQSITINGTGANPGIYPIPAGDSLFTFHVVSEDRSAVKEYTLTVHRDTLDEYLQQALGLLTADSIRSGNPDLQHVTSALALYPSDMPAGIALSWTASPEGVIDTANGAVARPAGGDAAVLLTAAVEKDGVRLTKPFNVTVQGLQHAAPVAVDGMFVSYGQPVAASLEAEDDGIGSGGGLIFTLAAPPANGTATVHANGGFVYTPNAGFTGEDFFTFQASDGLLDSNIAKVTIRVFSPTGSDAVPVSFQVDETVRDAVAGQTAYSFQVPYTRAETALTVAVKAGQQVTINGVAGSTMNGIRLNPGDNTVTVVVTAEDGLAVLTYTLTVRRDPLPPEAPVLQSLLAGTDESNLKEVAMVGSSYSTVITGGTSVFVKPVADSGAAVLVNGALVNDSGVPVRVELQDYQTNIITIRVQHPEVSALFREYELRVQADSGFATVTGATYGSNEYPVSAGNRIVASTLPYGTYQADITIHTQHADAVITGAWQTGSPSVVYAVYGSSIRVPLNNTALTVSFAVRDRNHNTKTYELELSQGEAPPPQFAMGLVETSGSTITVRFDTALKAADSAKIRYRINGTEYTTAEAVLDHTDNRLLKLKLGSPVIMGESVLLLLDAGAVTSATGQTSAPREAAIPNLSLTAPGGSGKTTLDIADLFQVKLDELPADVILHILNQVTPRFAPPKS